MYACIEHFLCAQFMVHCYASTALLPFPKHPTPMTRNLGHNNRGQWSKQIQVLSLAIPHDPPRQYIHKLQYFYN